MLDMIAVVLDQLRVARLEVGLLRALDERLNLGRISFRNESRLAILGCLGRSLGQAPTSAKSESDWIHFCHAVPPQEDDQ